MSEVTWMHPLPRVAAVDRERTLVEAARDKRTVHVGFVDEHLLEARVERGDWLHARLGAVASSLVGLDVAEQGVEWARREGYEAYVADAQSPAAIRALGIAPAEVVIAGEVIEHLDQPGPFLQAMRELVAPGGRLVVTTPNQVNFLAVLGPVSGREPMHPDHMAAYSVRTLQALGERNGWALEKVAYYQMPDEPIAWTRGPGHIAWAVALRAARGFFTLLGRAGAPFWSDGLIATYRRAEDAAGAGTGAGAGAAAGAAAGGPAA